MNDSDSVIMCQNCETEIKDDLTEEVEINLMDDKKDIVYFCDENCKNEWISEMKKLKETGVMEFD